MSAPPTPNPTTRFAGTRPTPNPHVFGIRHHGPGSARSLRQALEELRPDAILVEGPPDAADVLPLLAHPAMQPPVALLVYSPERTQDAVYYPFALFSPEWQAIHYGLTHGISVRFMDLPQAHQLAMREPEPESPPDDASSVSPPDPQSPTPPPASRVPAQRPDANSQPPTPNPRRDPLGWLAEAAGYSDGERWWEHMVEQRQDSGDLFAAILEAMTVLRECVPAEEDRREAQREAFMRQTIRAAQREGFAQIAVVCGAWHAPALASMPPVKADVECLKGLPKTRVQATWVPWSYGRLTIASGYGAGIHSPGWYHHLWSAPEQSALRWMTRVARLLRDEDLDASAAQVIDAVRLAETLATLRDRPRPGLPELNEATRTALCFGSDVPIRLIHEKLIVGEKLGEVPDETPMVPLQQDLLREQRRLRLPPCGSWELGVRGWGESTGAGPQLPTPNSQLPPLRTLDLDLRKPNDRDRSFLLHRLALLDVPWGRSERVSGKSGTFHEVWGLEWQPEFAIKLIEAGIWGRTILEAAAARTRSEADRAPDLPALTRLLQSALLADLPEAVRHLMERLQAEAALASDVSHLMAALPPLASVLRYGNVRQTDAGMVSDVVDGLIARICIGLPGACASLNDEAAAAMLVGLVEVNGAVALLQQEEQTALWQRTLQQLADQSSLHGLLSGRCCRLLVEAHVFDTEEASRRMGLALSLAGEPSQAAAWVEGFLKGSGLLLLHDDRLWQVLDAWVTDLSGEIFIQLLPLLRRTFSTFPAPERRAMGERVRRGSGRPAAAVATAAEFDTARAEAVLPLVARLLGLAEPGQVCSEEPVSPSSSSD